MKRPPKTTLIPSSDANIYEEKSIVSHQQPSDCQQQQKNIQVFGAPTSAASFLSQQQMCICPQLYALWRTQHLKREINIGNSIKMRVYSQGRIELAYPNGILEVQYGQIKLTKFTNGDFKLIDGDKVSYWNQELLQVDRYFVS